jgi:SAM-dependent methyltransferase
LIAAHHHYPDFANPELLEKIPLSARTVLDIGCAEGALGADYLRRNPKARVLGIELNPEAAAHARERISEVFCGDVEVAPMPFAVPDGIDCIVYGDVLEHLVDPWALLVEHAKYLAPDGTVLVCMPNVEHWSFAAQLLSGQFDYHDEGLFDRTHLRWFTPRTMAQALTDAGLQLADVAPRPIDKREGIKFINALAPALQTMGIDPANYANRALPLQYIWRARKAAPARMVVNATMLTPQGGVSDVRVIEPLRALRTDSSVYSSIKPEGEMEPELPGTPRIAILHRPLLLGEDGLSRVRALLKKDYLVISEFDDHPNFLAERGVNLDELLTFRAVHAVQTSTPDLAQSLAAENPEVGMFLNGVFELPKVQNYQNPDQLTLFFAAINRRDDWAPLIGALNDVARAVGPRLRFHVMYDQAFFEALQTTHKQFSPMTDYAGYMQALAQAEIAFMPLTDTAFNRAKSDLKFIEAGAARVTALASRVVYGATIQDGVTGVMFNDEAGLRGALLRLLSYPEATKKIGDAARAYVGGERMLAYQVATRTAWYRSLWERREALNAALRERVPGLFS